MKRISFFAVLLFCVSCSRLPVRDQKDTGLPEGFVYLSQVDPTITQEMRYAGNHNFIGEPIDGYLAPRCILTRQAAEGLASVQAELKDFSMSLKVYDCYRPQKAVDHFIAWAKDVHDTKMKKEFYPDLDKSRLFIEEYIAEKSGHSRGSTIDLTLVPLPISKQAEYQAKTRQVSCVTPVNQRFRDNSLDFGTGFDCFDPLANTANPRIGHEQKQRRLMLRALLEKHGFKNYPTEWWHFTLVKEPFPATYFTFPVQ